MVLHAHVSLDDIDDLGLTQSEDDYFIRDSMEESWNPLGASVVDSQYCVDQAAYAPIGQPYNAELARNQYYTNGQLANSSSGYHTTPYSSQLPSFHTAPTSEQTSLEDLSAEHRLVPEGHLVDLSQSQDTLQQQDAVLFGIDPRHLGIPIAEDLEDDLPENVPVPSAHSGDTIGPSSRPVPDPQREPAQGSTGTSSQKVDNLDLVIDRLEADVIWLLTLNPSFKGHPRLCAVIDKVRAFLNACENHSNDEGDKQKINKGELYYVCFCCGMATSNIHVLKRHVADMHYPELEFHCRAREACPMSPKKGPRRRDKVPEHYRVHHDGDIPSREVIDQSMVTLPCEPVCVFCRETVQNWKEFYDCFAKHCMVKPASPKAGSSQRDDNDRAGKKRKHDCGHDTLGGGAGAGGPASSQQGYGRTGNATGRGQQQSPFGSSGNQMRNGDSRPLLRQRSASDGCDGRMKGSQAKAGHPPKSIPQPSDSGGGSASSTKRPSKKKGSQPRLDPRNLQGQAPSQPPVNKCKSCPHIFNACPECCTNPPSGDRCHDCPNVKGARGRQAGNPNANRASGRFAGNTQPMGFPQHAQYNHQGFHDAGLNIPMMPYANLAYAAMQQQRQRPNQLLRQRDQGQSMGPRMNTQQGFPGGNSSYMTNAVYDVQVRGMSELEIETSILSSKSKLDSKKTQGSNCWSVALPFRGTPPPLRKALLGMMSIPAKAMGIIARRFIGPVPLTQVNPSSMCQCACRTKSQGTYFARGRMDMAGGRRIELDFRMAPDARTTGHPLRTRIQVVVKMLRLRSSATRSASAKHKQEAHDAIKKVLEATLDGSETTTITHEDEAKVVDLDNPEYDSDAESVAESTFSSSCSRTSSCTDLTQLSPPSSPPAWTSLRTSTCTDLSLPSPHASPELSVCSSNSSCTDLELPGSSLPIVQNWNDVTLSSEKHSVHDLEVYGEEEKELELTFDLDLKSSLDMLARWTGVPTDDLRSSISVWDPERVFRYIMNHLLFVIFSLARSRDNDTNPCWAKKGPSQS